tara:strand:- start:1252 stop:1596 length:345 start_codon:yes stop_codon:yes gene_type:complete
LKLALHVQLQSKTTNAETVEHVGIQKLKQLNMVNIEMFRHPKYYKELRKLRNKEARVNDHSASISDQAISDSTATAKDSVRPGPGLKQQASSSKQQASSTKLIKQQAASIKPRG